MTETFDYLVIGGGSAGATLAGRLSEDGGRRVLLIEAGGLDLTPAIHVPGLLGNVMSSADLNWNYVGEPDPSLDGRALTWMGGRVLGGSSSINGMVYGRGLPNDYERWVAAGNPGWGWEDMLPWFRRMEHWRGRPNPARGVDGPLQTRPFKEPHQACTAAMRALIASGVPFVEDYSIGIDEGIGATQATQRGGWRHSAARAYLGHRRPNLVVRTRAHVTRLVLEGRRCVGVEYRHRGALREARATREVIVCLGAIGSPALLLRSGIGDADALAALGIEPTHHLPGVGRHLNEHVNVKVSATVNVPTYNSQRLGLGKLRHGARWLLDRKGPASSPANHYQGFVKTEPSLPFADVQIQLMAFAFDDDPRVNDDGITAVVSLCRPRARGAVSLRSADPLQPSRIAIELLSDEDDVMRLTRGCRLAHAALTDGLDGRFAGKVTFPATTQSDADWLAFMRRTAGLNWHPTSTCRMGPGLRTWSTAPCASTVSTAFRSATPRFSERHQRQYQRSRHRRGGAGRGDDRRANDMKESRVDSFNIQVERATSESVAPFGRLIADTPGVPVFARWEGATVHGPVPLELGSGGELLLVKLAAKPFPVQCGLIERHFKHTQAYLPANGRPFVMLLGRPTMEDAPDYPNLRAFLFEGLAGIVLQKDVWHDFPYALEDDTRFCVILREEAHIDTSTAPLHPMDADGPDLQRRAMRPRANILIHLVD